MRLTTLRLRTSVDPPGRSRYPDRVCDLSTSPRPLRSNFRSDTARRLKPTAEIRRTSRHVERLTEILPFHAVDPLRGVVVLEVAGELLQQGPHMRVLRLVSQAPDPSELAVAGQLVICKINTDGR